MEAASKLVTVSIINIIVINASTKLNKEKVSIGKFTTK